MRTCARSRLAPSMPLAAYVIAAFLFSVAAAGEVILSFDSAVDLREDGTVVVTETIRFVAEGKEIRRGIYRDIPLPSPSRCTAGVTVLSFLMDGVESRHYQVKHNLNDVRVTMGDPGQSLSHGEHTFTLAYETCGELRFSEEFGELGWNVTGDRWAFDIEEASCRITLPPGGTVEGMTGWLGAAGSWDSPIVMSRPADDTAVFVAEKTVKPGEHFTVAIRFDQNLVANPDEGRTRRSILAVLLSFGYFFGAWLFFGRDPKPGTVIPRFYPPEAGACESGDAKEKNAGAPISAAAASFVKHGNMFDLRAFASLFISLAARGACRMRMGGADFFVAPLEIEAEARAALPAEERIVYDHVLKKAGPGNWFGLTNDNAETIISMHDVVVNSLSWRYGSLWASNLGFQICGWLIVFPASVWLMNGAVSSIRPLLIPTLIAVAVFLVRRQIACDRSRSLNSFNPISVLSKVGLVLGYVVLRLRLVSLIATGVGLLVSEIYELSVFTILLVAIPLIFSPEMKAPSRGCRRLMDEIDGLLMYMNTAEKDRLQAMNPPEETPEIFERLLPYAVAFGLEDTWCARFADKLAVQKPEGDADRERPVHLGNMFRSGGGRRFSSSLAEASVKPPAPSSGDSSSKGGGSFFSGGGGAGSGGGGGGGGGW